MQVKELWQGEVLPPEPQEAVHWLRARKVFQALVEPGINTIADACQAAGVPRATFYRDIAQPEVAAKLGEWLAATDATALALIVGQWPAVLQHQARLARGAVGSPRDSTPAARFLQSELARLREQAESEQKEGPSEAAKVLARFRDRAARVKATRTTVVEELEVEGRGTGQA